MSLYSQSLKSQVFEPRVDTATRTEFRLDKDAVYLGNFKLQVGCAGSAADMFNKAAGGAGLIRRISLYDGATLLDECREANRYLSWFNQGGPNDNNRYVSQELVRHEIGFSQTDDRIVTGQSATGTKVIRINTDSDLLQEKTDCYLDLRVCLPFLNAIGVIDTALFDNLRLLIEYEDLSSVAGRAKVLVKNTATTLAKRRPLLVVDEVKEAGLKQKTRSQVKPFQWNVYEHDLVQIPEIVAAQVGASESASVDTVQSTSRVIDGFRNKYVSRMVMMKAYSNKNFNLVLNQAQGTVVRGVGDYASNAQHKEKVQLVVNGRQLFTGKGLEGAAQIADAHADAWGNYNIMPFTHQENVGMDTTGSSDGARHNCFGVAGTEASSPENDSRETRGGAVRVGQHSFIGIKVEDRLTGQLQLKYERSASLDANAAAYTPTGAGLDLHVYAEIPKKFDLSGGKYSISYV